MRNVSDEFPDRARADPSPDCRSTGRYFKPFSRFCALRAPQRARGGGRRALEDRVRRLVRPCDLSRRCAGARARFFARSISQSISELMMSGAGEGEGGRRVESAWGFGFEVNIAIRKPSRPRTERDAVHAPFCGIPLCRRARSRARARFTLLFVCICAGITQIGSRTRGYHGCDAFAPARRNERHQRATILGQTPCAALNSLLTINGCILQTVRYFNGIA